MGGTVAGVFLECLEEGALQIQEVLQALRMMDFLLHTRCTGGILHLPSKWKLSQEPLRRSHGLSPKK